MRRQFLEAIVSCGHREVQLWDRQCPFCRRLRKVWFPVKMLKCCPLLAARAGRREPPTSRSLANPKRCLIIESVGYSLKPRNLSELVTTEIDEALIAKAANMGLMRMPRNG